MLELIRKAWFWLYCSLAYLVIDTGLYLWWSRLGQRIFEGPYVGKDIRLYENEAEVQAVSYGWGWIADKPWQLFDMISAAAATEARGTAKRFAKWWNFALGRDCDDTSYFQAVALKQIADRNGDRHHGRLSGWWVRNFSLLIVPYFKTPWLPSGHTVCVFQWFDETSGEWVWAWSSNWFQCKVQWTRWDGTTYKSLDCVVREVCKGAHANVRWAHVDLDLKTIHASGRIG